jgi:hypothetical protein
MGLLGQGRFKDFLGRPGMSSGLMQAGGALMADAANPYGGGFGDAFGVLGQNLEEGRRYEEEMERRRAIEERQALLDDLRTQQAEKSLEYMRSPEEVAEIEARAEAEAYERNRQREIAEEAAGYRRDLERGALTSLPPEIGGNLNLEQFSEPELAEIVQGYRREQEELARQRGREDFQFKKGAEIDAIVRAQGAGARNPVMPEWGHRNRVEAAEREVRDAQRFLDNLQASIAKNVLPPDDADQQIETANRRLDEARAALERTRQTGEGSQGPAAASPEDILRQLQSAGLTDDQLRLIVEALAGG